MRCIDADALERKISISHSMTDDYKVQAGYAISMKLIEDAPTIEPRKKGKWIPQNLNKSYGMISTTVYYYPKCSVCGQSANYTNFCPNCGADMREDGEADETD